MKFLKLTKRRKIGLGILVLAIVLAYSFSPKIPAPPETVNTVTELDTYLKEVVNSGSPQGLSILIVKNDSIVYSNGFGWADRPRNIKATPETVYHWWSIT